MCCQRQPITQAIGQQSFQAFNRYTPGNTLYLIKINLSLWTSLWSTQETKNCQLSCVGITTDPFFKTVVKETTHNISEYKITAEINLA